MSSAMTITMSFAHSPTYPSLHLRYNSFSNPSVALPTSLLILQPFCCFTYVQFILQTFFCFSYITSSSFNSPAEPPMALRRHLSSPTLCRLLKYCYNTTINVVNFINKIIKIVMKGGKIIKITLKSECWGPQVIVT